MWDLFPQEVKVKIISQIPIQEILPISHVNKECAEYVRFFLKQYLLETQLEQVVASGDEKSMRKWKRVCYDRIPKGHPDRNIILFAIFFFLGKHNLFSSRHISCFGSVICFEYRDFNRLGHLFNSDSQIQRTLKLTKRTKNDYLALLRRNPETQSPLFGKITVHNPHFEVVFNEQLSKIFDGQS